ncbi:MAG: VOC family protein [Acidimicrobiia bacterium]
MRQWSFAAKVDDVDREIAFLEAIGAELLLEDNLELDGRTFRLPLLRWGTTYVHVFTAAVYEHLLPEGLPLGIAHVVYEVDDFEDSRKTALQAGATEIAPPAMGMSAKFGRRDVAFFRSPGGMLFEFIKIYERGVP